MQPKELTELVKRLRNSYGLKQVDAEIIDFIYSKCGSIPSKAVSWIEERFQTVYEKMPVKLHGAITACWWDYLREHPESKAVEYRDCPYCDHGRLDLVKWLDVYKAYVNFAANCGNCKQRADEKQVPMITVREAQDSGYERWNPDKHYPSKEITMERQAFWLNVARNARKAERMKGDGAHERLPGPGSNQPPVSGSAKGEEIPF